MAQCSSYVSHLACARCGNTRSASQLHGKCSCGGPLLCRYDLGAIVRRVPREDVSRRPPGLWRYRELLPIEDVERVVTLGEGSTPLVPSLWGASNGLRHVWFKDKSQNPTGTFKARGA